MPIWGGNFLDEKASNPARILQIKISKTAKTGQRAFADNQRRHFHIYHRHYVKDAAKKNAPPLERLLRKGDRQTKANHELAMA